MLRFVYYNIIEELDLHFRVIYTYILEELLPGEHTGTALVCSVLVILKRSRRIQPFCHPEGCA